MHNNDTIDIAALETAAQAPATPFGLFAQWFAAAEAAEPCDPNAMALATADASGKPSVRIVLLKMWDESGFVFFTNRESRKGDELKARADAALCLYWKSMNRQVRIEGTVTIIGDDESDAYFATRNRGARIGAWASRQSRPLDSRATLAAHVKALDKPGDITRPPHWGGYRLAPHSIEFWHEGKDRLHTRLLYTKNGDGWTRQMLYP